MKPSTQSACEFVQSFLMYLPFAQEHLSKKCDSRVLLAANCSIIFDVVTAMATLHRYSVDVATLEHIPKDVIEQLQEHERPSDHPATNADHPKTFEFQT